MPKLIVIPQGREIAIYPGERLLDAMVRADLRGYSPCGGRGACGKCAVRASGELSGPTESEQEHLGPSAIAAGIRLACQATVEGDVVIASSSPTGSGELRITVDQTGQPVSSCIDGVTDPLLQTVEACVDFSNPARSDMDEALAALESARVNDPASRPLHPAPGPALPQMLAGELKEVYERSGNLRHVPIVGQIILDELIAISGASTAQLPMGIALDVGTTTLVAFLVDLGTGCVIDSEGAPNPQACMGADLISRIAATGAPAGLIRASRMVVEAANALIDAMLQRQSLHADSVFLTAVVGNTCMQLLFAGVSPWRLAQIPFAPAASDFGIMEPGQIGLGPVNPRGRVFFLPSIGGFVGSDALAVALASGLADDTPPTLAVDLGTNGEIILAAHGRMLAASTAAGPAFEGVNISCGTWARPGAIYRAYAMPGPDIQVQTIDDQPACGICGSGLISLVAAMRAAMLLDGSGYMSAENIDPNSPLKDKLVTGPGGPSLAISPEVSITQRDVREFQLAKAAVRAGAQMLLEHAGVTHNELERVIVAGAFGTVLDIEAVKAVGLLPPAPQASFEAAGNAAGRGCVMALCSRISYARAFEIARRCQHIDLGADPRFIQVFADSMIIGEDN